MAEFLAESLGYGLTWAKTRPAPEVQRKVSSSSNDAGILKEAARMFRLRQLKTDVSLFGTVYALRRNQHKIEGLVTLKAMVSAFVIDGAARCVVAAANFGVDMRATMCVGGPAACCAAKVPIAK